MEGFEDHFSLQAGDYSRFRPHYPPSLFDYLASIAPGRQLAWDCGTGNGQAALQLARQFGRVIATDASPEQIAHATSHERIEYRVERVEEVNLAAASVDLVTVAIAVHWFDLALFYAAVKRVLIPRGILAVWSYHLPHISSPIDAILARYYSDVLAGYWPQGIEYIERGYRTLPFPFHELTVPEFEMQADWELEQLMGFLSSWSATQRYQAARSENPLSLIQTELAMAWGAPHQQRRVRWPLDVRVGQVD